MVELDEEFFEGIMQLAGEYPALESEEKRSGDLVGRLAQIWGKYA